MRVSGQKKIMRLMLYCGCVWADRFWIACSGHSMGRVFLVFVVFAIGPCVWTLRTLKASARERIGCDGCVTPLPLCEMALILCKVISTGLRRVRRFFLRFSAYYALCIVCGSIYYTYFVLYPNMPATKTNEHVGPIRLHRGLSSITITLFN